MNTSTRILLMILVAHLVILESVSAADWTVKVAEDTYIGLSESHNAEYTMLYLGPIECKIGLPLRSLVSGALGLIAMVVIVCMARLFWPKPIRDETDL